MQVRTVLCFYVDNHVLKILASIIVFDPVVYAGAQSQLFQQCESATVLMYSAYANMQALVATTTGANENFLFDDTIPALYYFTNTTNPYVVENVSLVDLTMDLSSSCNTVVSFGINDFNSGYFNTNRAWRVCHHYGFCLLMV